MNNSFKFIVNPNYTYEIEITSFLQYCALKNTLSEFNSNNIKPLKNNRNPVSFSNKITNIESNVSFTKYIHMERDEKDAFKTKIFKEEGVNLFFDAISDSLYSGLCKNRVFLDLFHYDDPDYQTVNDLYKFFTSGISAEYYLSKYIPKNSKEVCYISMHMDYDENDNEIVDIYHDDGFIKFDIIRSENKDSEYQKEYSRIVNSIYENIDVQKIKNNGYIENTYNESCVYTEDPTIIHKVLMNNQSIINKVSSDIDYLNLRQETLCLNRYDIFIELQISIANVENSCKSAKKKVKDNLAMLNDLFK